MLRPVDHELLCVVGALYDGLERYALRLRRRMATY